MPKPYNNKKNRLLHYLTLLIVLFCFEAKAAVDRQQLHEMRTLSASAVANVLVYYNLNGAPYIEGNAQAWKQSLARLTQLSKGQDESIGILVRQLQAATEDLTKLPQSAAEAGGMAPPYSRWLPKVCEVHHQLNHALSALIDSLPPGSDSQDSLRAISNDLGQLLVSYEMASFFQLGADLWLLDESTLRALDDEILQRLTQLSSSIDMAEAIKVPARDYRFVRKRLLSPVAPWTPNAVERYLMRAIQALDAQAGAQPG